MRYATLFALVTLAALLALACSGGGSAQPTPRPIASLATSTPAATDATATPDVSSVFPVVLEHDTLVVASADGSGITETPLEPGEPLFRTSNISPDGARTATFEDGTLSLQEGDGDPKAIATVPSTSDFADVIWAPDSSRLLFDASPRDTSPSLYLVNADGSGLTLLSEGLSGYTFHHAWSVDGTQVAFGAIPPQGVTAQMYVTRADGTERALLGEYFPPQGDEGWDAPAWSRDGARIAAVNGGGLRIFDIVGGTVRDVAESGVNGFSWSPDGRVVAFDTWTEGFGMKVVMVVDVTASAEPRLLIEGRRPRWSPSGERIAFERGGVFTIRPDGTNEVALAGGGPARFSDLTWSEDSRDVEWVREASREQHLYAIDVLDGTVIRTPTSLTEAGYERPGFRDIELAPNAEQVAFQVPAGKEGQFAPGWYTMNVDTGEFEQITDGYSEDDIYWLPQPVRIVTGDFRGVFVAEGDLSPPRLISDVQAGNAVWSPDGTRIAFGSESGIHVLDADGANEQLIGGGISAGQHVQRIAWSPDGSHVLYDVTQQNTARKTFLANLDGSPPVTLLTSDAPVETTWSPDGDAIAYLISDVAATELWLMNPDGGDQRRVADFEFTNFGNSQLRWSPDGASIAMVVGASDVYVVDVETGSSLLVVTNAPSCRVNLLGWSPDSQRLFAVPFCEFTI